MAQTLAMRATALAGSATLLTLATMAALSVTYTVQRLIVHEPTTVVSVIEPELPPRVVHEEERRSPPRVEAEAPITETLPPVLETVSDSVDAAVRFAEGPVTVENPRWLERPRNLARYYPRRAVTRGMQGEVTLDCLVSTAGALRCAVVSETPANWGFGEAALRIAQDHRMAPATRGGETVEGRYRMRVPFELE